MRTHTDANIVRAWQEAVQAEAKPRPWFAALLLQKGSLLFDRFVYFYGRLTAVGQRTKRQMAIGLGTAALALALSQTPAHAATITVGGGCTLVQAIQSANSDTSVGGVCTAGSGADTIVLAGNTYSYSTANGTDSALPNITSPITIQANGATIQRDVGAPNMRVIRVNAGGNLTLNNATITGGTGVTSGGGIFNVSGTLTLNNSTVSGNTATQGGGIFTSSGTLTLNNSTVSGNTAFDGGGISNNSVSGTCTDTPRLIVNNSTVSSNTATNQGGGIFNFNGVAEISHSTVTGNSAPANSGAGVRSFNDSSTCTRVGGSIIAGNLTGGDVAAAITTQRFYSLGHNLIGTNGQNVDFAQEFTTTGDITNNVAPGLGSLANNGGPTLTHALVTGSPAIDIAPAAACSGAPINGVDQRGVARSQDGNADSTAACDAGAVEMGQLQCGIQAASEPILLTFTQSSNVSVNVSNDGTDLDCVRVTEIGYNHPEATSSMSNMALETGRYWQIVGYQNSTSATPATADFTVDLTLPFASADVNSRVCKWLEGVGPGFGWDCDNSTTSHVANTSVTRAGIGSFSDWAVGDEVGPTAVTNLHTQTTPTTSNPLPALLATLLTLLTSAWLWARRQAE